MLSLKTRLQCTLLAFGVVGMAGSGAASAATLVFDNTSPVSIPGIANVQTDGNEMAGLSVTAVFAGGVSETLAWAPTGAGTGGVTGTGWSLSASGDTFFDLAWNWSQTTAASLQRITLDGGPGLTLFDTDFGASEGTPNSALGNSFFTNLGANIDGLITATYSNVIQIGANAAVGDLFQILDIDFSSANLPGAVLAPFSFQFSQDTDNDIRAVQTPEAGTLAVLGIGLVGLGFMRRRRSA